MFPSAETPPFERFRAIDGALQRGRGWFESAVYLRYAAIAAIACEGPPEGVAGDVRATADALKRLAGWFGDMRSELRYVVAAGLRLRNDSAEAFDAEVRRARKLFRQVGLRRDSTYETLAILILRSGLRLTPIETAHAARVKEVYDELKQYQWWLTGADDLPACAMLALRPEPVGLMAQRIEQIHQGLRSEGLAHCNELQTAANLLYLSEGRADLAVGRAGELVRRFKARRTPIRRGDYDTIATLAFLLRGPQELVETVLGFRDQARALKPRPDKHQAFNIGAHMAFLDLVRFDEELQAITQIKLIVDVQAVIAAQRAAAAVIAASAAG